MDTELLDQLNQVRLSEDLTYAELGEQIGIDGGALHRILNRQAEPIDRTLFKVRRFLDQRKSADQSTKPSRKPKAKERAA